jgi:hypothetical protein
MVSHSGLPRLAVYALVVIVAFVVSVLLSRVANKRRRPAGDISAKLPNAELEGVESHQEAGSAEADHATRVEFLTGTAGIRAFVSRQYQKERYTEWRRLTFTVEMLASALSATHSEVEEALVIVRSRGHAKETSEKGHWEIRT